MNNRHSKGHKNNKNGSLQNHIQANRHKLEENRQQIQIFIK